MSGRTLREVLRALGAEGLVDPESVARLEEVAGRGAVASAPWFVRVLVGLGAWIASLFLTLFVGLGLGRSAEPLVPLGLLLVGGAIAMRRGVVGWQSDFAEQFALAMLLTGQLCLLVGLGETSHDETLVSASMLVLQAPVVAFFPDPVGRFLAVLAAAGALLALLLQADASSAWDLAVLLTALPAGLLWWRRTSLLAGSRAEVVHPAGYGLVTACFGFLLASLANLYAEGRPGPLSTGVLTLGLAFLADRLLGPRRTLFQGGLTLGILVALGGATLQAPGVMASLGVLVLGFRARERVLVGMAWVFLAVFLTGFYYNLDVTLLEKSGILVASGALLLALREGVRRW